MNKISEALIFLAAISMTASTSGAVAEEINPAENLENVKIIYQTVAVTEEISPLMEHADEFANLNGKIAELQGTLEAKQSYIYIVKKQKEIALEAQEQLYVDIDVALADLAKYVGVTPYVLSGSTPQAWDCSGLTLWFYETYRGITLPHSATSQQNEGTVVDAPIPGDIVAFTNIGFENAYHVGIYLGGGLMIDALNANKDTVMQNIAQFADSENSKVAYIRY
jgi:cell wall-associated NlpC family hydrolase